MHNSTPHIAVIGGARLFGRAKSVERMWLSSGEGGSSLSGPEAALQKTLIYLSHQCLWEHMSYSNTVLNIRVYSISFISQYRNRSEGSPCFSGNFGLSLDNHTSLASWVETIIVNFLLFLLLHGNVTSPSFSPSSGWCFCSHKPFLCSKCSSEAFSIPVSDFLKSILQL